MAEMQCDSPDNSIETIGNQRKKENPDVKEDERGCRLSTCPEDTKKHLTHWDLQGTKGNRMASMTTNAESVHTFDVHLPNEVRAAVAVDLSMKKRRRPKRRRLSRHEVQRAKNALYCTENEQYTVEKLRTMVEDLTEFLDAIWDVYCSEARLKGESVSEEGRSAAAVLQCVSSSGEGSWDDLQLLSRAKSVLVLRSKKLAAPTISLVEKQLGFETDIKSFIVRLLKFWMGETVTRV